MKKYISLLSFIAMFFVGMQFSVAQEKVKQERPEAIAKQKTFDLHQLVSLTGEQQGAIFKVLVDVEQNVASLSKGDMDIKSVQKTRSALLERKKSSIKAILTPEQFKTYSESLEIKK